MAQRLAPLRADPVQRETRVTSSSSRKRHHKQLSLGGSQHPSDRTGSDPQRVRTFNMNDTTVSYDSSELCPKCCSPNWVIDEGNQVLYAEWPTNLGERACNDCGAVWPA